MVKILIGNDIDAKKAFVEKKKVSLDSGLWGLNYKSVYPADIKDDKEAKRELHSLPMSGKGLVVFWDIDSLKKKIANVLKEEIAGLLNEESSVDYVFEGSGMAGTVSGDMAGQFNDIVMEFGEVPENRDIFAVCRSLIFSPAKKALKDFTQLKLSTRDIPQFLGSLRAVIERDRRLNPKKKLALSQMLINVDLLAKYESLSPMELVDYILINRNPQ